MYMDPSTMYYDQSVGTGIGMIFWLIYYVIYFGVIGFLIASMWKVYEKAGEKGWKVFIPFYSQYILYKISGKVKLFWAYLATAIAMIISMIIMWSGLIAAMISSVNSYDSFNAGSGFGLVLFFIGVLLILALSIVVLVFSIIQNIGLAKAFGQETLFAVGLIFVPVIFFGILAFSKNIHYVGDQPLNINKGDQVIF